MKNHLKRIASPRTWVIDRKSNKYIMKPNAGGHSQDSGLALGLILRDNLKLASTMNEVRKILNNKNILVDGKRRKDPKFIVGLFDVISIPLLKKSFRLVFDKKGRILVKEISEKESTIKVSKIVGKTVLVKNKIQLNLHDGKNILSDDGAKVGDSVVLSLPDLKVKEVLPLKEGVTIFLTKGKHGGSVGKLKGIKNNEATYSVDGKDVETARNYLFVIGDEKGSKIVIEN
mgnify:CR=1 FL=1